MNFLGHIYFSKDDLDLMHANLFGDFVKGRNLDSYLPRVREGIVLHRAIDHFIGVHPACKRLSAQLSPDLPKVAPVAIDIFFDHFLSLHWEKFHAQKLDVFLDKFYNHPINLSDYPNEHFQIVIQRIKTERWLSGYADLAVIARICKAVSRRISFPNALMNGGEALVKHYTKVEDAFFEFMRTRFVLKFSPASYL